MVFAKLYPSSTSLGQPQWLAEGTKMSTELQDLQKGGSLCDTDPYEELLNALKKRNLQLFHELLNRNDLVEPDHWYGDPDFTTCMDLACKNEDCVPFIEALLKHNANPNLVNHKRAPIHVAAEAGNTPAFLALLASNKLDVNKVNDLGDTAFHTAAKKLKAQRGNHDRFIETLLSKSDINVNIASRKNYTGLHWAAKRGCRDTVENLLKLREHDVDSYRTADGKTARETLEEKFPGLEIPQYQPKETTVYDSKTRLFGYLYKRNSDKFITDLQKALESNRDEVILWHDGSYTFLQYACDKAKRYVRSPENYLEIIMLVVVGIIIFKDEERDTIRQHISAIAILLSWAELVLLIGRHPLLSTNIEMLKRVSWNFLKFLAWYSILIVAFALSFYTLFRGCQSSDCGDDDENFFLNPGMSVLKTVVMLTGEFDASSIPFLSFPITSQLMFVLFVFLIAIVLFNLLNGLAVSDTQAIKDDAEIVGYVSRVQLIYYFETILLGNPLACVSPLTRYCCCLPFLKCLSLKAGLFRSIFLKVCLFPYILPGKKIYVLPNQDCRVVTDQPGLRKKHKNYFYESNHRHRGTGEYNTICFLDQEISKEACNILANRGKKSEVDQLKLIIENLTQKLDTYEQRFDSIDKALRDLLQIKHLRSS
uniref:Ion transport domain-containing protein n=1 Tax=Timema monikensis TaxID=170555 RepID=A0A7R9DYR6_9NEOP|nr:unnamed protein product [Timema monikensis]